MRVLQVLKVIACAFLVLNPCLGQAEIIETPIAYKDGSKQLEGVLVENNALNGPKPTIIVIHDWLGITDDTIGRARMLAELGYTAFAADIYGKGIRPKDTNEAMNMIKVYKADQSLMRSRINAALQVVQAQAAVDRNKIAAIGYCFGGTVALELARSGADIAGVVAFHGGLASAAPADAKNIKAKVLALHGADDPWVPDAEVSAFEKEMRDAKVDWQLIKYGNSVHAFTIKKAGNDNAKGAAYNALADKRSWQAMRDFFVDIFG